MFSLFTKTLIAAVLALTFISQTSGSPLVKTDLAAREVIVARDSAAVHVVRTDDEDDLVAPQEAQHLTPADQ